MKFYLTKAAQLEAEGRAPKAKPVKKAKADKSLAVPTPSSGQRVKSVAPASVAPAAAAPSAPAPVAPAPATASAAPASVAPTSAPAVAEQPAKAARFARTARPEKAEKPAKSAAPVKPAKQPRNVIAIGGQPRVDLLPLEVRAERKAGIQVRRAWLGVAAVVILVGIGGGAATLYSQGATASLAAAQAQTATYSQQAAKYSAVKTTEDNVNLVDAARLVGGSTDINWPKYLAAVALTVPSGAQLSGVTVDSASPVVAYAQAQAPLEGQRVATLTLTATSASLPSVPTWLNNLTKVNGYEDATAGTVALSSGVYTATVTLHINEKAFSNAYKKGN